MLAQEARADVGAFARPRGGRTIAALTLPVAAALELDARAVRLVKIMDAAAQREWTAEELGVYDDVDAAAPRYTQTVWGVGYVFVPDGAG